VHDALRTGLQFWGAARCVLTNHKIDQLGNFDFTLARVEARDETGVCIFTPVKITLQTMTTFYMAQSGT
jgi:hypothetical protein